MTQAGRRAPSSIHESAVKAEPCRSPYRGSLAPDGSYIQYDTDWQYRGCLIHIKKLNSISIKKPKRNIFCPSFYISANKATTFAKSLNIKSKLFFSTFHVQNHQLTKTIIQKYIHNVFRTTCRPFRLRPQEDGLPPSRSHRSQGFRLLLGWLVDIRR